MLALLNTRCRIRLRQLLAYTCFSREFKCIQCNSPPSFLFYPIFLFLCVYEMTQRFPFAFPPLAEAPFFPFTFFFSSFLSFLSPFPFPFFLFFALFLSAAIPPFVGVRPSSLPPLPLPSLSSSLSPSLPPSPSSESVSSSF
jgi:hypothetical protein